MPFRKDRLQSETIRRSIIIFKPTKDTGKKIFTKKKKGLL